MDKVTLIRSVPRPRPGTPRTRIICSPATGRARRWSIRARRQRRRAEGLGRPQGLPPFVAMPGCADLFGTSGYLTPAFGPFSDQRRPERRGHLRIRDLTPAGQARRSTGSRRRAMKIQVARRLRPGRRHVVAVVTSRDKFSDKAYDLLTSSAAQKAFRMSRRVCSSPGTVTRPEPDGLEPALLARRLVESGVSFTTAEESLTGARRPLGWDTHAAGLRHAQERPSPSVRPRASSALIAEDPRVARTDWPRPSAWSSGRVRPDPEDQPDGRRDHAAGRTASCSRAVGFPGAWSSARPTPRPKAPSTGRSPPPDLATRRSF